MPVGRPQVPHWVWLSWVPQLLTGTQRPESAFCKHILKELARLFPQVPHTVSRHAQIMNCPSAGGQNQLESRRTAHLQFGQSQMKVLKPSISRTGLTREGHARSNGTAFSRL